MELFVPGRVCLFGEHSDWAGGFRRFNSAIVPGRCIVAGTNQVWKGMRWYWYGLVWVWYWHCRHG
ncbi:galactokinase family protein, partial [Listeria monocytogenes]|uniref:galactokinase family protein n=1 Tax=Listeria monocytogenes TaxID=1639 RepID=UPI003C6D5CB7